MVNEHFITEHITTLKSCVIDASKEIMDVYESDNFGEINKSDGSPLTLADKRANELILERLKSISSSIPVISEETFNQDCLSNLEDVYWLVDPLDGTKEFINKTNEFTVNIALIENKRAVFGIVGAPVMNKIWYGSVFNNNHSDSSSLDELRIVMSKSHKSENDKAFLLFLEKKDIKYKIIEKGSSLKLCSLADSNADIYPRFGPTSEWDIAAAHAVLSSFGGSVISTEDERELSYAKTNSILNPYFIAFRNNAIKDEFLPVLRDFFQKLV